jgi:hypothetical protein
MKIYTTAELQEKEKIENLLKEYNLKEIARLGNMCYLTLTNRMKYLDIVNPGRKNSGRKRKVFHFNTINTK